MKSALLSVACLVGLQAHGHAQDEPRLDGPPPTPDGGLSAATETVDREAALSLARKALARIKDGAWEEAAEILRRAHNRDPRSAAIATDLGYTLAHLGKRDEAERMYRIAVGLDPKRFYAYVNLAELWTSDPTRWQRHDEMVSFLQKGLESVAGDARAHAHVELLLGELLGSLGRAAEARRRLQPLTGESLPAQVRRRALRIIENLDAESHGRALEDWPLPPVRPEDRARLAHAKTERNSRETLQTLDALVAEQPAWVEVRWERSRLLEKMGQFDEATADLTIVVQLMPSHALAWRHLGTLLALHGGRFEADRADEALRQALALEPSWSDLRDLRTQVAAKRSRGARKPAGERAPEPTAKARQLFQDAQSWMGLEAPEMAPPLLRQALSESPAFVEAAAALYALEHTLPEGTIKALWNDGSGLWQLALAAGALRSRETAARPWIDRAIELGVEEARFGRASLRASAGDRAGALEDLRDYVAGEPSPPRLEEARALRVTLSEAATADSPERLAQLRLAADRPSQALVALGGSCRVGLPFDSLLALGRVREFMGDARTALGCYQQALDGRAGEPPERLRRAFERLAAAATALPVEELTHFRPSLEAAAQSNAALAWLALARMAEARGQWAEAAERVRTFLARADADEPRTSDGRALQARVDKVVDHEVEQQNQRQERIRLVGVLAIVAFGIAGLGLVLLRLWYRKPLLRALRTQPLLFPLLAKAIGQVRHDVLKHRAGALELLADPATDRGDVLRALLEPTPASDEVAGIYQHLAQEAAGLGLHLCPLASEPVFGPLARDLAAAEHLLHRQDRKTLPELHRIDGRLRGGHADRLQGLLRAGPRTLLNAGQVARWIDLVANEPGRLAWVAPTVHLHQAESVFPLPESTLFSIFSNLLRNAVEASSQARGATVEVRVEQGRDMTGRRLVSLLVADSSPQPLDMEHIEKRPADRGLGIVRETSRTWGGEILVRAEAAPFSKTVGVRFPAPPEVSP